MKWCTFEWNECLRVGPSRVKVLSRYFANGAKNKNLVGKSGFAMSVVGFNRIEALKKHIPFDFTENRIVTSMFSLRQRGYGRCISLLDIRHNYVITTEFCSICYFGIIRIIRVRQHYVIMTGFCSLCYFGNYGVIICVLHVYLFVYLLSQITQK